MGRFATTAPLYEQFRPPYPAAFFQEVAERLGLKKSKTLIDLGTGPALLALGFAEYIGRVVAVDPEPSMLEAAREAVKRAGQEIMLVQGRAEDLPEDIGRFDVVTIGRALHWFDERVLGRCSSAWWRPVVLWPCALRSPRGTGAMRGSRNIMRCGATGLTRGCGPRLRAGSVCIASFPRSSNPPHFAPPR